MELVLRNARLSSNEARVVDIGIAEGKIAAIAPKLDASAETVDAGGRLVVPGFVESHIHLDKSHIFDRATPETERVAYAVKRTAAVKRGFTVEDVAARARRTLDMAVAQGVTRMRTHVEVDPGIGLRGWEGIKPLVDEYRWAIDIELCVFPQEGLTNNPGTDELLVAGLRDGARVVAPRPATTATIRGRSGACSSWPATSTSTSTCISTSATPPRIWTCRSSASSPRNTSGAVASSSTM
jgi:cytosine/creatinine deaminase